MPENKEVDHSIHLCNDSCKKDRKEEQTLVYKDRSIVPAGREQDEKGYC